MNIIKNDVDFIHGSELKQSAEYIADYEIPDENRSLLFTILDYLEDCMVEECHE